MPVVPTQEILKRAVDERYGVAAINVINDLTMEAALAKTKIDEAHARAGARGMPLRVIAERLEPVDHAR